VPPLPDHVPPALDHVVRRAMAKDPAQRYPDGAALAEALREAGGSGAAVPPPPAETTQVLPAAAPAAVAAAAATPGTRETPVAAEPSAERVTTTRTSNRWPLYAAAVLALLALLAALIGALVGLGDTGSPADVDPSLGNLHTNDPAQNNLGADLLYVMGSWVYDSFHDGWNELHPIKACSRIGRWDGDWPAGFEDTIKRFDQAFEDANNPDTRDEQDHPRHEWTEHPDVDGCDDEADPPPPIR